MRFLLATSDASAYIRPVQNYLFDKYMNGNMPEYIDMKSNPIEDWCKTMLKALDKEDGDLVFFGLDDFLITSPLKAKEFFMAHKILLNGGYERFELGYAYRSFNRDIFIENTTYDGTTYLSYPPEAIYSVSTQFSLWKTDALRRVLAEVDGTPWIFETQGKCSAACFLFPVFGYIEESALSKRWEGINVNGMKKEDYEHIFKILEGHQFINIPS